MQVLRAVVTSGSVSAAATNLGYTPSAISQQVSTLEDEAGTPLLEKVGRGVRPTPAGTLLAERASAMAELLNSTEVDLANIRAGRTGLLRVLFFQTAGAALMPSAVARFRDERPEVRLDLRVIEDGFAALAAAEADIATFVVSREVPSARSVRTLHLVDEPYSAVLPQGHPLANRDCVDLVELSEESWVSNGPPSDACAESLSDAFASAGFNPHVALEADGPHAAQGFVAAGLGVSLLPGLGLEVVHPGVVVRPVRRPEPVRRLYVGIREAVVEQPATRSLLDALFESARRKAQ